MADPRVDVTIGANVQPFAAGIQSATTALKGFLTLGAFAALARSAVELGGSLSDMAAQNQVNVRWLQEVGYAATQTGSSLSALTGALTELRRAQAQAIGGSKNDRSAFAELGITLEELQRLGVEELFDRVAEAVRRSGGAIKEVNAALAVLGRGGKSMLAGMTEGFGDLREEARRLGLVLGESTIAAMDNLGDAWERLKLRVVATTAVMLESLTKMTQSPQAAISEVQKLATVVQANFAARLSGTGGFIAGFSKSLFAGEGIGNALDAGAEGYKTMWSKQIHALARASGNKAEYMPDHEPGASGMPDYLRKGLMATGQSEKEKSVRPEISTDALKRIGLFVGSGGGFGSGDSLLRVQNAALEQLKAMRRELAAQARERAQGMFTYI